MNDKEKIEDTQRQIDDLLEMMQEVLDNTSVQAYVDFYVRIMRDLGRMKKTLES